MPNRGRKVAVMPDLVDVFNAVMPPVVEAICWALNIPAGKILSYRVLPDGGAVVIVDYGIEGGRKITIAAERLVIPDAGKIAAPSGVLEAEVLPTLDERLEAGEAEALAAVDVVSKPKRKTRS